MFVAGEENRELYHVKTRDTHERNVTDAVENVSQLSFSANVCNRQKHTTFSSALRRRRYFAYFSEQATFMQALQ